MGIIILQENAQKFSGSICLETVFFLLAIPK